MFCSLSLLDIRRTKFFATAAVLAALGGRGKLREHLRAARSINWRRGAAEVFLQLHLFAGFPGAIEALNILHSIDPKPPKRARPMSLRQRTVWGLKTCKMVYGSKFGSVQAALRSLHPDLVWGMMQDGYGKVLSRGGLSLVERELINVAILASLGWERQLRSHIIGSINVGAKSEEIREVLSAIRPFISPRRFRTAFAFVETSGSRKRT
ncbi:MAG: hypothetical protein C4326_11245 [Ignavibacteria bacterium]